MDSKIHCFTQPSKMTPTDYVEALQNKALCSDFVYDKYVLKGILMQGLKRSIWNTLCSYCSSLEDGMIHDLARHTTPVTNFQYRKRFGNNGRVETSWPLLWNQKKQRSFRKSAGVAHVNADQDNIPNIVVLVYTCPTSEGTPVAKLEWEWALARPLLGHRPTLLFIGS